MSEDTNNTISSVENTNQEAVPPPPPPLADESTKQTDRDNDDDGASPRYNRRRPSLFLNLGNVSRDFSLEIARRLSTNLPSGINLSLIESELSDPEMPDLSSDEQPPPAAATKRTSKRKSDVAFEGLPAVDAASPMSRRSSVVSNKRRASAISFLGSADDWESVGGGAPRRDSVLSFYGSLENAKGLRFDDGVSSRRASLSNQNGSRRESLISFLDALEDAKATTNDGPGNDDESDDGVSTDTPSSPTPAHSSWKEDGPEKDVTCKEESKDKCPANRERRRSMGRRRGSLNIGGKECPLVFFEMGCADLEELTDGVDLIDDIADDNAFLEGQNANVSSQPPGDSTSGEVLTGVENLEEPCLSRAATEEHNNCGVVSSQRGSMELVPPKTAHRGSMGLTGMTSSMDSMNLEKPGQKNGIQSSSEFAPSLVGDKKDNGVSVDGVCPDVSTSLGPIDQAVFNNKVKGRRNSVLEWIQSDLLAGTSGQSSKRGSFVQKINESLDLSKAVFEVEDETGQKTSMSLEQLQASMDTVDYEKFANGGAKGRRASLRDWVMSDLSAKQAQTQNVFNCHTQSNFNEFSSRRSSRRSSFIVMQMDSPPLTEPTAKNSDTLKKLKKAMAMSDLSTLTLENSDLVSSKSAESTSADGLAAAMNATSRSRMILKKVKLFALQQAAARQKALEAQKL